MDRRLEQTGMSGLTVMLRATITHFHLFYWNVCGKAQRSTPLLWGRT